MQGFVQKVVEGYIIFLFFDGLLLFSLFRSGAKSRRKAGSVLIITLFSAVIWIDYFLIYSGRLPIWMAYVVPAVLLVLAILFHKTLFPFKTHCQNCKKALSITEFLSCDDNLCAACYEKKYPEMIPIPPAERIRRENEEKKKAWIGWEPDREYVIAFAFDEQENVLLIDHVNMDKKPGKHSGIIGAAKASEPMSETAARVIRQEAGLECEEPPEYMGRLNFVMPNINLRFHIFIARKFSGSLKDDPEKKPIWVRIKKLNYKLMSMDYPLWLPRTLRGQKLEYYGKCNTEGKIYEDILDLDAVI